MLLFLKFSFSKSVQVPKDFITFIISFFSLLFSVIPKPIIFFKIAETASKSETKISLFLLIAKIVFVAGTIMCFFLVFLLVFFLYLFFFLTSGGLIKIISPPKIIKGVKRNFPNWIALES